MYTHTHTHTRARAHTHTYTQGYAVRCPVQVQADVIQQAFDKVGGEGVIPPHFDPEIGDITIDFSTLLDEKKVFIST